MTVLKSNLHENDLDCIMHNNFAKEEFGHWIDGIPYQMQAGVELNHDQFKDMVNSMLDDINHGQEKEVYFYHSDLCKSREQSQAGLSYAETQQSVRSKHLGSASWITDFGGVAVQHIQYLPYGEPYINQHPFGYSERFTFTGKERDEETGFSYFGARYYDADLLTGWMSVDPMSDKYPSISPYNYCGWNPAKLVDPDGRDGRIIIGEKDGEKTITIQTTIYIRGGEDWQATKEELNIIAKDMNFAASKYRRKKEIDDCIVSFDINFKVWIENVEMQEGDNTVTLQNNTGRSVVSGEKMIDAETGSVIERMSGNNTNINSQEIYLSGANKHVNGFAGMHEVFHLLGLKDRYSDDNKSDIGYERNIMGGNASYYGWLSREQYQAYITRYSSKEPGVYIQTTDVESR